MDKNRTAGAAGHIEGAGASPIVPLTLAEASAVRAAVQAGTLPWREAQERLIAAIRGGRLWRTPEWKELRGRLIQDSCQQCHTSDGPLTLQHFWHPPKISKVAADLRFEHRKRAWEDFRVRNPFNPVSEERLACPRCKSVNIYSRDRMKPRWKCNSHQGRRWCHYEFDEPVRVQAPARKVNAAQHKELWERFQTEYAKTYAASVESFDVMATVMVLENFERYLTGQHTATFCRKCAYLWDKRGVRLCHVCRAAWHKHDEPACTGCRFGVCLIVCRTCGTYRHADRYPTCYRCAVASMDTDHEVAS